MGHPINQYAQNVLSSLGGLTIEPIRNQSQVMEVWRIRFEPYLVKGGATPWERQLGTTLSPLGKCSQLGSSSIEDWCLFIGNDGRLYAVYDELICFGNDFEDSLSTLLFGTKKCRNIDDDPDLVVDIMEDGSWLCEHADEPARVAPPTVLNLSNAVDEEFGTSPARTAQKCIWCPDCGTYWRVWTIQLDWGFSSGGYASQHDWRFLCGGFAKPYVDLNTEVRRGLNPKYQRVPIRDIDCIIAAALKQLPDLRVRQQMQHSPKDDDKLWFFWLPSAENNIVQLSPWRDKDSENGSCPFLVEHEGLKPHKATTIEQAAQAVIDYLSRQLPA